MKKLLTLIAISFTLNCNAQDTTYYLKREKLYQLVRSEVTDCSIRTKYEQDRLIKRSKLKKTNRIALGIFAFAVTTLLIVHNNTLR